MADLTTLANVKGWLNIGDTNSDTVLTRLVSAASSAALTWMNRTSFTTAGYTEQRDGKGTDSIVLLNYPVTAVTSLVADNIAIPASPDGVQPGYVFDVNGVVRLIGSGFFPVAPIVNGLVQGYPGYFPRGRGNVSIAYTAGYASVPLDLEQAVIDIVSLWFRNRDRVGVVSQNSGNGLVTTYSQKDLPASALMVLTQYKRNDMVLS